MDASFYNRLLVYTAVGAVLGLAVGFALQILDVIDNPFWMASAGTAVARLALSARLRRAP